MLFRSLSFRANELFDLSALALAAALAHVLNHAFFKSLMFCGAGVIHEATHERDIEKLGGLVRRMPYTSLFMLMGALAASGLPPLNVPALPPKFTTLTPSCAVLVLTALPAMCVMFTSARPPAKVPAVPL